MAVAFDAVASDATMESGPVTWTHTPSGTPTAVGVGIAGFSGGTTVTGVTYGGQAMALAVAESTAFSGWRSEIWGLPSPPSGAQTVSVTLSGVNPGFACVSITVTGSDTTTCFTNTNSGGNIANSSTSASIDCTSAVGELVMDIVAAQNNGGEAIVAGGGQTERFEIHSGVGEEVGSSTEAGAATVTMSWTNSVANGWTICAASFKAAAAAGGSIVKLTRPRFSGGFQVLTGGFDA